MSLFTRTPAEPGHFAVRLLRAGDGQPIGVRLEPVNSWLATIGGRTAVTPFGAQWRATVQEPDGRVQRPDGSYSPCVETWFVELRQIWQGALRAEVAL